METIKSISFEVIALALALAVYTILIMLASKLIFMRNSKQGSVSRAGDVQNAKPANSRRAKRNRSSGKDLKQLSPENLEYYS